MPFQILDLRDSIGFQCINIAFASAYSVSGGVSENGKGPRVAELSQLTESEY